MRAAPGGCVGHPEIWRASPRAGLAEGRCSRQGRAKLEVAARPGPWTGRLCWWPAGLRPADSDNGGPGLRALEVAVSGACNKRGAAGACAVDRGLGLRPIAGGDSGLPCLMRP
ncbi:hypothetical protein NDU88_005065 [Pleurodeles waltl]|uniref:Uncharacterized protein n=1 Tax=Pleurodeles waltl TaxID=8319 RepID=A0AAV7NPG9_PLEWA|nr:hypothetical protein NDU88_005065 [Pleurodeles waltl]